VLFSFWLICFVDSGWRIGWNILPSALRLQQENSSWLWCSAWEHWGGLAGSVHHQSQGMITCMVPCYGSGGHWLACHHGGLVLVTGQFMCGLRWTKWHWDRFLQVLSLPIHYHFAIMPWSYLTRLPLIVHNLSSLWHHLVKHFFYDHCGYKNPRSLVSWIIKTFALLWCSSVINFNVLFAWSYWKKPHYCKKKLVQSSLQL